jgi:hypothetical protein
MFVSGLGDYGNRPRRGFDRAVTLGWLAEDQQPDRAAVSVAFAAFTGRASWRRKAAESTTAARASGIMVTIASGNA